MFSSEDMNAVTPQDFFDQLNTEFQFTLDAAASVANAKCKVYYDEEANALTKHWRGRVWCNPPYGRTIGNWIDKAVEETARPSPECCVVMLLPARTDTKWFKTISETADEIRFVKGRLKFSGKDAAPFPSMIAIWYGNLTIQTADAIRRSSLYGPYEWNLVWRAQ